MIAPKSSQSAAALTAQQLPQIPNTAGLSAHQLLRQSSKAAVSPADDQLELAAADSAAVLTSFNPKTFKHQLRTKRNVTVSNSFSIISLLIPAEHVGNEIKLYVWTKGQSSECFAQKKLPDAVFLPFYMRSLIITNLISHSPIQ